MKSRLAWLFASVSLLIPALVLVSGTNSAQAALPPESFAERWCGSIPSNPPPCLESVKRNTVTVLENDPNIEVQSTGQLTNGSLEYFMFLVAQAPGGTLNLQTTDTWEFVFDTGTLDPNYTEAFAGVPDVDRIADGDGTFHVQYTAKPIIYTHGCDSASPTWPWACDSVPAIDDEVKLQAEVWDRTGDDFINFHRSQSPQGVNGIFLLEAADGSRYLESEMVNSHYLHDGTTVFNGEVRFRIPYAMLRDSFGVPDPSTMVASSLSGTVNGSTTAATFTVVHDPDGGGMIVDITGLTFSVKRIKVKRGVIVPTKPTNVVGDRVDTNLAKLKFTLSTPRGANVTGYQGRCESPGGHVVTKLKTSPTSPVKVGGLRAGVPYSCKVRAKSKAGYGPWSASVSVPRNP